METSVKIQVILFDTGDSSTVLIKETGDVVSVSVHQIHSSGFYGTVRLVGPAIVVAFRSIGSSASLLDAVNGIALFIEKIALIVDSLDFVHPFVSGCGMAVIFKIEPFHISCGKLTAVSLRAYGGVPGAA